MMTPGGLALAPGTRLPDNWRRSGAVKNAANLVVSPADLQFKTYKNLDSREHKEKAFAVTTSLDGDAATFVGAGAEWTEDLKDNARRLHEDLVKHRAQYLALDEERAKAKMQAFKDHIDRKVAAYKANPVTMKDPGHSLNKERKVF